MTQAKQKGIFNPASAKTLDTIKRFNETKQNTFLIPTGLICSEAGQVGYLLNEYFKQGNHAREPVNYKTSFANSRFEALQGAVKIARHKTLSLNGQHSRDVLVYDPTRELQLIFDPLDRGQEKALVPGIRLFENIKDIVAYTSKMDFTPTAVMVRDHENIPVEPVVELFNWCRKKKVITILDESNADLIVYPALLSQISPLPGIVITGEPLTQYEMPFGAVSTSRDIYKPWDYPMTCRLHGFTTGGNRPVLSRVRDYLLSNVPLFKSNQLAVAECQEMEQDNHQRLTTFSKYVNTALPDIYAMAGLDLSPVKAHGSTLTILKNQKEEKILDCISGGGVVIRGHTPDDIVDEVIKVHDTRENYWKKLSQKLTQLTGFSHVFPAVSGSTAVEIAIIMAMLANKNRTRVIVFDGNHSGTTLLSMIGTASEVLRKPFYPFYFDVKFVDPLDKEAKELLEQELESKKTALVWFEVFQGQPSRRIPQDILDLVDRCREKNGYIVGIDGVLTGLYKTGTLLGCEGTITPDIITLFKGLTDATFPIGVTLVSSAVYKKALSHNPDVVKYLENLYINQLGSHISLHVLEKVTAADLGQHVNKVSTLLKSGLQEIAKNSPLIAEIQGEGLLLRIKYSYESKILKCFGRMGVNIGRFLINLFMCRLCLKKAKTLLYLNLCGPCQTITEPEVHLLVRNLKKVFNKRSTRFFIYFSFPIYVFKALLLLKKKYK